MDEEVITRDVVIEEYYDGFAVIIDGVHFNINQEDSVQKLQDVFAALGIAAEYEEVC